jgi:glyoxylase-like metal-dependent hydrolase (beta-lactamase superfamily II)
MALALLAATGSAATLQAQDWSKVQIQTEKLTDNVYVLAGAGGNIAVLVGEDGAMLVDSGFAELSEKVATAVKEVSKGPVRFVVNTHWHFDHVGGNEALAKAGAEIWAHHNTARLMSQERSLAGINRKTEPSPEAARPVLTFDGKLHVHFDGEEVDVISVPPAHTNGDCFVYFRKANVLHLGDTMFNGQYPFIDINAGGSIDGMVAALDKALALADEHTKIIPGHGPVTSAAGLREYRDMLAAVRDRVRKMVAEGKSRDEVIAAKPTSEFDARWGQSWLKPDPWVALVYGGMTRESAPPIAAD